MKHTPRKRILMFGWLSRQWMALAIVITALLYAPLAGRASDERARQHSLDTLTEVMGLLQKQALDPPPPKAVVHASIQGMLHTLDPHSNYMDETEWQKIREEQRGSFFGIGSVIQQQMDGIVIVSTVRGGPSEKAGIRTGDYIREIDGKSTDGWSSEMAVQKLHGEKGTLVDITIGRPGFTEPFHFTLTRSEIPSNSIYYCFMLTPTTGYILVKDFGETTAQEFERSLGSLKAQGMKELILDLRGNPGGMLDAATGICRQLLGPDELIVSQRGRDGRDSADTRTPPNSILQPFPIVVLINRGSASASEIVTGAIQDHDRGLVVGQTSWGKGLVQSVLPINRTRGLLLTTARYYTPSGRCIQRDYQHSLDDYLLPEDDKDAPATPTGEIYHTDLNRVVYGGGGITPDVVVEPGRIGPLAVNLRYHDSAFFKFAVHVKESRDQGGIKPLAPADDATMERFRTWLKGEKVEIADEDWKNPSIQSDLRKEVAIELQNVIFGQETGQKFVCGLDPQVLKAQELMGEAEALLRKKILATSTPKDHSQVARN
jgi:carboxyl-terminal processing protease